MFGDQFFIVLQCLSGEICFDRQGTSYRLPIEHKSNVSYVLRALFNLA